MKNRVKALKVKIKSLAAEAAIIRTEERRALGRRKAEKRRRDMGRGFIESDPKYLEFVGRDAELHLSLRLHRVNDVRREARLSILAYGFIRGTPYAAIERPAGNNPPDWGRVLALIVRFGGVAGNPCKCTKEILGAWRAVVPTPVS